MPRTRIDIIPHLDYAELNQRYRRCRDVKERTRWLVICLLSRPGNPMRGYGQNQLVADNGVVGGVEVRIPLASNVETIQLLPFFDIGTVWNNRGSNPDPQTLASLGLGLQWQPFNGLVLRADYGIPLIVTSDRGSSLQDNGFNFSVRYQPF